MLAERAETGFCFAPDGRFQHAWVDGTGEGESASLSGARAFEAAPGASGRLFACVGASRWFFCCSLPFGRPLPWPGRRRRSRMRRKSGTPFFTGKAKPTIITMTDRSRWTSPTSPCSTLPPMVAWGSSAVWATMSFTFAPAVGAPPLAVNEIAKSRSASRRPSTTSKTRPPENALAHPALARVGRFHAGEARRTMLCLGARDPRGSSPPRQSGVL